MFLLLVLFAVIHSGGAALRPWAEEIVGARLWRIFFATASIPLAVVLIGYFLAHRYDGVRLWNLQGVPGMVPLVWVLTAVSFFFLYHCWFLDQFISRTWKRFLSKNTVACNLLKSGFF